MEHVVFFLATDGGSHFRRTPSLEEAVRVVEHLRNNEGVEELQVFSLAEVPLTLRPYYHVEVPASAAAPAPTPPAAPVAAAAPSAPAPPPAAAPVPASAGQEAPEAHPEPAMAASTATAVEDAGQSESAQNGKGPGPRGLGFFSR